MALNIQLSTIPDALLPSLMRVVSKQAEKRAMLILKLKHLYQEKRLRIRAMSIKKSVCVYAYVSIYIHVCVWRYTHTSITHKPSKSELIKSEKLIGTKRYIARDHKYGKITVGCLPGHTVISSAELSGIRIELLLLMKTVMLKKNQTPNEFPVK